MFWCIVLCSAGVSWYSFVLILRFGVVLFGVCFDAVVLGLVALCLGYVFVCDLLCYDWFWCLVIFGCLCWRFSVVG